MNPEMIINLFDRIAYANAAATYYANDLCSYPSSKMQIKSYTCPDVDRVIFNGDYTIVWFKDKTKTMVKRSSVDKDDKQTSIVYAIVKRMFGRIDADGNVDSYGFYSWISKLAKNGFDQQLAEATEKERKAKAKAEHIAKQQAEHEEAVARRIKRRSEELAIERAARAMLDDTKLVCENTHKCSCEKRSKISDVLNETVQTEPKKKFKDFTQDEKRAYWREAKRRRGSK